MTTSSDWIGRIGDVWAEEWRRTDRSFAALSVTLDATIAAAAPAGPFRALDIGCGAGATSLALARSRPAATILGIDLSPPLVDVASDRLATISVRAATQSIQTSRVSFLAGDALELAADHAPFDLLYSRHGVMFFEDPVAAFTRLHAAAAPDATLIFSCFRDWSLNAFAHAVAGAIGGTSPRPGPGPFAFADSRHVARVLASSGWQRASARPVDFAYRAGEGDDAVADALAFLQRVGPAASRLRTATPVERPDLVARLTKVIERYRHGKAVDFPASAWIWSAQA